MENLINFLITVLTAMSFACPFVIEFLKNLIGEDNIVKTFKDMKFFSLIVTVAASAIVLVYIAVFVPSQFAGLTIPQIVLVCIAFAGACAVCSQGLYDKVIKAIMNFFIKK